jgi:hypothetical protein
MEKINTINIVNAGKSIKNVVLLILSIWVLITVCSILIISSHHVESIKTIYILGGFVSLFLNILVLVQLYSTGNYLENSIIIESSNLDFIKHKSEEIKYVKHKTNKGIIEIAPCINFKNQNVFKDNLPAPDGEYKLDFFNTIQVKNGIII